MSVYYRNNYWLLGEGADEEAKRWVAQDKLPVKKIVYSSPRAVEMEEIGNHLSPELPIPPEGFVVVVVSDVDVEGYGLKLGVAHWGGDGGWIERKKYPPEPQDVPEAAESNQRASPKSDDSIPAEADFLEELKRLE